MTSKGPINLIATITLDFWIICWYNKEALLVAGAFKNNITIALYPSFFRLIVIEEFYFTFSFLNFLYLVITLFGDIPICLAILLNGIWAFPARIFVIVRSILLKI